MPNDFVKIANKQDIPEGQARAFEVHGERIAVCHYADKYYAIADICTHDGAPLDSGELIDNQIECPRHGARFDIITGKALCLPAVRPVDTYKVEERGEEIWVSIPTKVS